MSASPKRRFVERHQHTAGRRIGQLHDGDGPLHLWRRDRLEVRRLSGPAAQGFRDGRGESAPVGHAESAEQRMARAPRCDAASGGGSSLHNSTMPPGSTAPKSTSRSARSPGARRIRVVGNGAASMPLSMPGPRTASGLPKKRFHTLNDAALTRRSRLHPARHLEFGPDLAVHDARRRPGCRRPSVPAAPPASLGCSAVRRR